MTNYGFLINLILTILVEGIVSFLYGIKDKRNHLLILCINAITNVSLSLLLTLFNIILPKYLLFFEIIFEIIIIFSEYIFFKKYLDTTKNKFNLSLINNLFSLSIGILLTGIINVI